MTHPFRILATASLVALLAFAAPLRAEQTPTEKIAACINNAADHYVDCTTKGGILWDQFCLLKYEADALLCALDILPL